MELKTSYKQVENTELNGIELYFEAIPTKEEREALKNEGFRWNVKKSCWYKRKDTKGKKKQSFEDIESLKVIEDYNEFKEIFKTFNSWLKKEKDFEYFYKKNLLVKTQDGYILEIEEKAPAIESRMYYDDETPAPSTALKSFKDYNMRYKIWSHIEKYQQEYKSLHEGSGATGYYDYKGFWLACYDENTKRASWHMFDNNNGNRGRKEPFVRYLTKEEQTDLLKIYDILKQNYIDRLEKYYKRYGQHIHTWGYWANR